MNKVLLADPFWLPLTEVRRLTDRQKWELYVRPALLRQSTDVPEPHEGDTIQSSEGGEMSPEQFIRMLAGKGIVNATEAEEVIARASEEIASG